MPQLKIALVGGTGRVGRHIALEAARRGHRLRPLPRAEFDVFDAEALARGLQGQDVLVSAYGAPAELAPLLVRATASMLQAMRTAGVMRIVTVGGAGGLAVAPGRRLADTADFPAELLPKVKAHEEAVALLAASGLDWTCLAPAARIAPGERSGRYRCAVGALVSDAQGRSGISYADFACALVDELEARRYSRQLVGVGD